MAAFSQETNDELSQDLFGGHVNDGSDAPSDPGNVRQGMQATLEQHSVMLKQILKELEALKKTTRHNCQLGSSFTVDGSVLEKTLNDHIKMSFMNSLYVVDVKDELQRKIKHLSDVHMLDFSIVLKPCFRHVTRKFTDLRAHLKSKLFSTVTDVGNMSIQQLCQHLFKCQQGMTMTVALRSFMHERKLLKKQEGEPIKTNFWEEFRPHMALVKQEPEKFKGREERRIERYVKISCDDNVHFVSSPYTDGSENRYTDLGANDGQRRKSSKHVYVPLTSQNNGTSKDTIEFSSLETKNSRERQNNKYTDVQLTSENSSALHSPIQPVVSNPAHNPDKYSISTVSTDDFLHMLDSALRDNVQQSLSNPENIKPGVKCTKKGLQVRIINGEFQDGPFRGMQAVLKTTIKDFSSFEDGKLPRWGSNGISEVLRFRDLYSDNTYFSCGMVVKNNRFYVLYPNSKRILKDHLNDKNQDFQMFSLIEMCHQVAEAMVYLSESGITHKDLAARNCVITEDNVVKVSDAAFSWDLFPDEYMYDSDRERYLPVRWLAIDSLISGFYDSSTDVWSFGVLLWEISSRALILPYPDIQNNQDIKDHVKEGFRPGQPKEAPKELYDLMSQCWKKKSAARPSFKDITQTLLSILYPDDQMLYENQEDIRLQNLPAPGNTSDNSYYNPAFQS